MRPADPISGVVWLWLALASAVAAADQQPANFPFYLQGPAEPAAQNAAAPASAEPSVKRATIPMLISGARQMQPPVQPVQPAQPVQPVQPQNLIIEQPQQQFAGKQQQQQCMYDRNYFAKFDECLARRPYPTVGLPAFKNDDLLLKTARKGDSKRGCLFTLSNGLFKNYHISSYSLDADTKCLDSNGKLAMSLEFSNATLYYLWHLRCLNYADQLLDDASMNGRLADASLLDAPDGPEASGAGQPTDERRQLCAGSSLTFGFAALQVSNIEAQLELATDIYKNWRVTNVTLAFARPAASSADQAHSHNLLASIRDFSFESLDGDELNWRYLQTYSNWSRNRMHSNFLEQFRRFVWISMQRCLSESSEKLPVKLFDLFGNHKYN